MIESLPVLAQHCESHGIISENVLSDLLDERAGLPHPDPKTTGKPLNEMAPSRQRAAILNNPEYLEVVKTRRAEELAKQQAQEQAKAAKEAKEAAKLAKTATAAPGTTAVITGTAGGTGATSRARFCGDPHCHAALPVQGAWIRCGWKYCHKVFCQTTQCEAACKAHRLECPKKG